MEHKDFFEQFDELISQRDMRKLAKCKLMGHRTNETLCHTCILGKENIELIDEINEFLGMN